MLDNLRNDEIISPSEIISPQTVSETEETFVFKIIVCGDAEVGKTSLQMMRLRSATCRL